MIEHQEDKHLFSQVTTDNNVYNAVIQFRLNKHSDQQHSVVEGCFPKVFCDAITLYISLPCINFIKQKL